MILTFYSNSVIRLLNTSTEKNITRFSRKQRIVLNAILILVHAGHERNIYISII
jgi:hypothetical protein